MATTSQIRDKVLKRLGVLAVGQSATAEQAADIDAAYLELYGRLSIKNLVEWWSADDVPAQFVGPVVAMVARERAVEYGLSTERYARIQAEAIEAERELRRVLTAPYVSDDTEFVDY